MRLKIAEPCTLKRLNRPPSSNAFTTCMCDVRVFFERKIWLSPVFDANDPCRLKLVPWIFPCSSMSATPFRQFSVLRRVGWSISEEGIAANKSAAKRKSEEELARRIDLKP